MKKNVILYDFFAGQGGAEFFTQKFSQLFSSEITAGYVNYDNFKGSNIDEFKIHSLNLYLKSPVLRYLYLNWGFSKYGEKVKGYDSVVLSGIHTLSAARNISNAQIIYYCHTIPRFAYDLYDYYYNEMNFMKRIAFRAFCKYIRWDFNRNIKHVDQFICNSVNVKNRIKEHTGFDATVVYPPVDIQDYKFIKQGDYYLSTARLEDHKRVELIIRAFLEMPEKKLIVVSGGLLFEPLKELAKEAKNITFTSWITKNELVKLMGECIASIYIPIDEDFGISPVESQAAGKPVIGVNEGGLKETIIDGETGMLCASTINSDALKEAVNQLTPEVALSMREQCEQNCQRFSVEHFVQSCQQLLN